MEMLATLHWVATEDPQAAVDCKRAIERFEQWSDRKRELFQPNHLRKAWLGWVETRKPNTQLNNQLK